MGMIAFAIIGGLVLLYVVGAWNQAQILRDWELALEPWGQQLYEQMVARADGDRSMAELALQRAEEARSRGETRDAARLLDVGLRLIEGAGPDWIRFLREMSVLSRMATVIAVAPPLRGASFHLRSLRVGASLGGILHHFLVTAAERFRLRVYLLGHGVGIAIRLLREATMRLLARGESERDWRTIRAAHLDFGTLSEEAVVTFRVLLRSFSASRKPAAVAVEDLK